MVCVCARPCPYKKKRGVLPKNNQKKTKKQKHKKKWKSAEKNVPDGGTFVGGITGGSTFGAIMPCGGNFLAVSGFSFFGGNDFGGGGKTNVWW